VHLPPKGNIVENNCDKISRGNFAVDGYITSGGGNITSAGGDITSGAVILPGRAFVL